MKKETITSTNSSYFMLIQRFNLICILCFVLFVSGCGSKHESKEMGVSPTQMDTIAIDYVKLVLKVGIYNEDYVDAYYGPEEWRPETPANKNFPSEEMQKEANNLLAKLENMDHDGLSDTDKSRHRSLHKQLVSVQTSIDLLSGKKYSFDEESKLLYDAVAPSFPESHYQNLIGQLEKVLPGKGDVTKRLAQYKKSFIIPKEKLDTVFKAAVHEARKRTLKHINLPAEENFTVEYVTGKSWSGYNWYKGNSYSLIQVNTDLPIYIDRAVDLACHEGYPGHHVFNVLMEKNLVKDRGWVEFSVYPLFSPQSLIAEGSANYGIDVAFPGAERVQFESEVLFPLAGLDPKKADAYYQVQDLTKGLSYAGNEAARQYLDGDISKEKAIEWMVKYNLMDEDRAAQRLSFIEQYRSYVINYNLGQDIVAKYIESKGGTADQPQKRWEAFEELLSNPHTPGQLIESAN